MCAVIAHEREQVPTVQNVRWTPEPVQTDAENLSPPPGFDPLTVQPVASGCTLLRHTGS